jgi:hypothetical protein
MEEFQVELGYTWKKCRCCRNESCRNGHNNGDEGIHGRFPGVHGSIHANLVTTQELTDYIVELQVYTTQEVMLYMEAFQVFTTHSVRVYMEDFQVYTPHYVRVYMEEFQVYMEEFQVYYEGITNTWPQNGK